MPDVASSFEMGHSMLLLHELASPAESETLRSEAAATARDERRAQRQGSQVRRYTWGTKVANDPSEGRIRMPVAKMLATSGQALADDLLLRAVACVSEEPCLRRMVCTLFGPSLESEVGSSPTILHNSHLGFTSMEPAINVYRQGGRFLPHTDKQALTVLVLLSEASTFVGGGTAFWSALRAGDGSLLRARSYAPTLLVTPEAGSALLFCGDVTHAGQPVLSGERCVLVASFSPMAEPDGRSEREILTTHHRAWDDYMGVVGEV